MDERGVGELETRMVLECKVWLPPGGNVKWTREVPVTFRRVTEGQDSVLPVNVPDPVAAVSSGLTAKAVFAPPEPFLPRTSDVVVNVGVGGVTWGIAGVPEMRIGDKVYKVQAVVLESSSAAGGDTRGGVSARRMVIAAGENAAMKFTFGVPRAPSEGGW